MLETMISLLAVVCSATVAAIGIYRWHRTSGYKSSVYLAAGIFAGLVALMNLSALAADGLSFIWTAALAYVGFATTIVLPAARALGNLTYETPRGTPDSSRRTESEDATV